jgi:hypothetical protein
MNTAAFLSDPAAYFAGSYDQFTLFGGPCTYFHHECLRAGRELFLSERHVEMLYATLAAWGMHRMGDETTKAKLTEWDTFRTSLVNQADDLRQFLAYDLLAMNEADYSDAVLRLRPCYERLELSISDATVVAHSKAFHHLFPDFIPPIDRQYTIRFFTAAPPRWLDKNGKFRPVQLPATLGAQFALFHNTCVKIKRLAGQVDPRLLEQERRLQGVTAPKAMDNAIMNYVRIVARALRQTARNERAIGASNRTVEDSSHL